MLSSLGTSGGLTAEEATAKSTFPGFVDLSKVKDARLWTVVQSGAHLGDVLLFNAMSWSSIYDGTPYPDLDIDAAWAVKDYLVANDNLAQVRAAEYPPGDYLVPSNAFLVVEYYEVTPTPTPTPVYDYVSETSIEGEGVFLIDKKVRNRAAIVNVDKHIRCNGSIDGFVINEYLMEDARGNTQNFKQEGAVDNYRATAPGHYLYGDEKLRSSFVFGGAGARIHETYDVQEIDARLESINLHSTGDQRYKTELDTINEFSGYLLIDARQSIPGVKHVEDRQEFFGNFTVRKHLIFRLRPDEPLFRDCP